VLTYLSPYLAQSRNNPQSLSLQHLHERGGVEEKEVLERQQDRRQFVLSSAFVQRRISILFLCFLSSAFVQRRISILFLCFLCIIILSLLSDFADRPRHDRGVGCFASNVSRKSQHFFLIHRRYRRWREIVTHDDGRLSH
jgi:hypothetical protein